MSLLQILFIAGCGLFGYWAVSRVLSELLGQRRDTPPPTTPPAPPDPMANFERPASDWAPSSDSTPWYRVLGLTPDADLASIMQAYTQLIQQYRADAERAVAHDVRQLCEQRVQQIEQAYQQALQRFK